MEGASGKGYGKAGGGMGGGKGGRALPYPGSGGFHGSVRGALLGQQRRDRAVRCFADGAFCASLGITLEHAESFANLMGNEDGDAAAALARRGQQLANSAGYAAAAAMLLWWAAAEAAERGEAWAL